MFEHLTADNAAPFEPEITQHDPKGQKAVKVSAPEDIVNAQVSTTAWLQSVGVKDDEDVQESASASTARDAFNSMVTQQPDQAQRGKLTQLKVPAAVRHLTGMLSAYDWQFIEQAKELRGYAVAQILEETKHPDAKVRLKALDMLGKVTEVALFTERIEVTKSKMSDLELEAQIKNKIDKFMGVVDAVEVPTSIDDVYDTPAPPGHTPSEDDLPPVTGLDDE